MTENETRDPDRFAATLLRASAAGLASATARRLLTPADGGGSRAAVPGGVDGFAQWRSAAENHIAHLAAALAAHRPTIFEDHVRWTCWACRARGVTPEEVRASLTALADTVREELPAETGARVAAVITTALEVLGEVPAEPPSALRVDSERGEVAARYLFMLLEGDRDGALAVIDRARADGFTIPQIYSEVFLPTLAEVGRLWQLDEVHVAEEHFATATTSLAIARLYPDLPRAAACGKTILTVAVEGDLHELGIRIVSDFFAMDGWRVVHLGSSVPGADLRRGAVDFGADLIAISASLVTHLGKVESLIAELRRDAETSAIPVIVGGQAFAAAPGYGIEIGADGEASGVDDAVRTGRRLVGLDGAEARPS